MLSDKTKQEILDLQSKYPQKRSALIPSLHIAQNEVGYLPREIQDEVAKLFGLEANEVNSVVSFYDMFHEEPVGKHVLHVCKNVSCMLRGADEIISSLCKKLNTKPHEISPDGEFTIVPSECLGACDLAPMMIVDETVVGPLQESDLDKILEEAKNG